jgi:anti-sigma regulatory factor (Ser/Thr protein kinase)
VATRTFPAVPRSVGDARRFARAEVHEPGLESDVSLVVSELATNAVLHARSSFRLTVDSSGDGAVRVEVEDEGTGLPDRRAGSQDGTTGRGLHLVAAVADRWGYHVHATGKVIWAELARR